MGLVKRNDLDRFALISRITLNPPECGRTLTIELDQTFPDQFLSFCVFINNKLYHERTDLSQIHSTSVCEPASSCPRSVIL